MKKIKRFGMGGVAQSFSSPMLAQGMQGSLSGFGTSGLTTFADGGKLETSVVIDNFRRNIMGTLSFDLKLKKMRKSQDFIVYPVQEKTDYITIQSDTRFGKIEMTSGRGLMSQSHANGAYGYHFQADKKEQFQLTTDQLYTLLKELEKTAGKQVGSSVVISDNSYADQFADGGKVAQPYTFDGESYSYFNTFGVDQNDFIKLVDVYHTTNPLRQMDRIIERLTYREFESKYGTSVLDEVMNYIHQTHENHEKYAKGGEVNEMYVVVGEKDGYWTIMSTPSSKEKAEKLLEATTLPRGEAGKVVSVEDAKSHKLVVGREYLKYAKGGKFNDDLYFDQLASMSATRSVAVKEWASSNNLSQNDLLNIIQGLGRRQIASKDFLSAVLGDKTANSMIISYARSGQAFKMAKGGEMEKAEIGKRLDYMFEDKEYQKPRGKTIYRVVDVELEDDENWYDADDDKYTTEEFENYEEAISAHAYSEVGDVYPITWTTYLDTKKAPFVYESGIVLSDGRLYVQFRKGVTIGHDWDGNESGYENKKNKKFAEGGEIAQGNYEMMLSQAKEVQHHAKELQNILQGEKEIEAWVVAKMENVSSTLSDITHYLDGKTEYADGGKTKRVK